MKKSLFIFGLLVVCILTIPFGCSVNSGISDNKDARFMAQAELNKYFVKCGDRWYLDKLNSFYGYGIDFYELRENGKTNLKEETLSESDKLNGIEYKGNLIFSYKGPQRMVVSGETSDWRWTDWGEGIHNIRIYVEKKKGSWNATLARGLTVNYFEITCDQVAKTKKFAGY